MILADRRRIYRGLVAGLLVAGLALSGCGRKGPLEPPPEAGVTTTTPSTDGSPPPPAPKDTGPVHPNKKFFLDWLL